MDVFDFFSTNQQQKITITILFEAQENKITFDANTSIEDIREALVCACDSICDSDYQILDLQANIIQIDKILNVQSDMKFFIKGIATSQSTIKKNILLDDTRKILVEIPPLRHVESQYAIKYILTGSNLLKHSYDGYPHIRHFQLSDDFKRILWYTKSKQLSESQISIEHIKKIEYGQESDVFRKYPLPMLSEYSFSVYYFCNKMNITRTLDLTCKDQREFDLWIIGIKALQAYFNKENLCKDDLLKHSKSYCDQVKNGKIGSCSKYLIYSKENEEKNTKRLDMFISNRNFTCKEISSLLLRLVKKVKEYKTQINSILERENKESNIDSNQDYQELFSDEAIADDTETQRAKMCNLLVESETELFKIIKEFLEYSKEYKMKSESEIDEDDIEEFYFNISELEKEGDYYRKDNENNTDFNSKSEFFMKEIDIRLWKLEVDIENIGDIIVRFSVVEEKGIIQKLKDLFMNI